MHKLCFYVPESHLESVKDALFEKGAGRYAHYDRCCWQVKGEGQYRPLENSAPFIGEKNRISKEAEYMVEMICEDHLINEVIEALIQSHPYETPAFSAWQVRITN
ncbi:MAG: NGG1p interacting factor NIF3 [Gammaproteobacteria bacterium RIFCSPHIGHO2_12_FULL_40_19]|nr:MAG: NGG1p interacting factor NIF3 [Gammaproteobacteria bacterium RIFCSPHIGHO2_12_FULL_40_19]